jgi:hypothetical protein
MHRRQSQGGACTISQQRLPQRIARFRGLLPTLTRSRVGRDRCERKPDFVSDQLHTPRGSRRCYGARRKVLDLKCGAAAAV